MARYNAALKVTHVLKEIFMAVSEISKISTGLTNKLPLSFTIISKVYRSFIPNRTTFTKYCFTQWISKLTWSFEIHFVRQYLVNSLGLADRVYATVDKTELIFTGLGLIFNIVLVICDRNYISRQDDASIDVEVMSWKFAAFLVLLICLMSF